MQGITILTIGVGVTNPYDIRELNGIASDPDMMNAMHPSDYVNLMDYNQNVMSTVCDGKESTDRNVLRCRWFLLQA